MNKGFKNNFKCSLKTRISSPLMVSGVSITKIVMGMAKVP